MNCRMITLLSLASLLAACGPDIGEMDSGQATTATPAPEPTETAEPPDPYRPVTLEQAWARFGDCMDLDVWENTGMPEVAWQSAQSGAGGGRCFSCHETGTGAALLSIDESHFFSENRKKPFVMRLVLGTVDESGAFEDLVPAWRFRDKGLDPNHPEYILSNDREESLESFVRLTLERYHQYDQPCP